MNHLIRILVGSLCAALVAGACTKNDSAEQDQQVPMVFHASSEAAEVKSGTSAFPYDNFGIWGIARMSGESDYVLWEAGALTQVDKVTVGSTTAFKPVDDAYWVTGYTYHFIALAPFGVGGTPTFSTDPTDAMTFSFDMAGYYNKPADYTFDLLGTVAAATVDGPASQHDSSQRLLFYHLLSQININVEFVNADGSSATGSVSEVRLIADKDVEYTVGFDNSENSDELLMVSSNSGECNSEQIALEGSSGTINVVPQRASSMELYLDFTLGSETDKVYFYDFKVNLTANGTPTDYLYNHSYNWNITIGPKGNVAFSVEVDPWKVSNVGDDIIIP